MLAALFILNLKLDVKVIRPYEMLVRSICTIGMSWGFLFSYTPSQEPSAALFLLVGALLLYPQFLVTDYIQYRKNKNDIKTAQDTVRRAVVCIGAGLFLLAASIYYYLTF